MCLDVAVSAQYVTLFYFTEQGFKGTIIDSRPNSEFLLRLITMMELQHTRIIFATLTAASSGL